MSSSNPSAAASMEYSRLGSTGMKVSRICLGCMSYGSSNWRKWVLDEPQSRPFIQRALELGINFFDSADLYSEGMSEVVLGNAIKDMTTRENVVIASKVFFPMPPKGPNDGGLSRKHIMAAVEASLKRLGTGYIDLYQIHRFDSTTPIRETMDALNDLVRSGKVRYIGASSMAAWQFAKMQHVAELNGFTKFISMQNHYNLVYREEEREMNPLCVDEGVGLLPWSPLARGFLAGNRAKADLLHQEEKSATVRAATDTFATQLYYADSDFAVVDRVTEMAKARGVSNAQLALAWLLHKPGVTAPIIGATKLSQLEEAVGSVRIKLSVDELTRLEELYKPHGIMGHDQPTTALAGHKH